MSAVKTRPWTVNEFFAWQEEQDERYELVDGFPQPLRMMTGASNGHDDIVVNIIIALGNRLRGKPCRPFTADGAIETWPGRIRRPDVGVDCGPRNPGDRKAAGPTVVFEVFSPSTRSSDLLLKNEEYRDVPQLRHIVFVEPDRVEVLHWSRAKDGSWSLKVPKGLDAAVRLEAIDVELPLIDIYDGVAFA